MRARNQHQGQFLQKRNPPGKGVFGPERGVFGPETPPKRGVFGPCEGGFRSGKGGFRIENPTFKGGFRSAKGGFSAAKGGFPSRQDDIWMAKEALLQRNMAFLSFYILFCEPGGVCHVCTDV
jgi:hypothetical protein